MARLAGGGLVAGLLLSASLPPFGWWPLGLVGVAVLARVLLSGGGERWRSRLVAGGACGVGLYGPGLWWVTEFHAFGWLVLVLLEAVVLGLGVSLVSPRGRPALALPAALVLCEAVRGRWPFGGLPLAGLDLGQVGGPLLPVARLGGHLLLVFVVGLVGVGLALLSRRGVGRGVACLVVSAGLAATGAVTFDGRDQGPLRVAAVQGGGVRGLRAIDADPSLVLEAHVVASRQVPPGTQLVVWPENVVDVEGPLAGSGEETQVAAVAVSLGTTLVAGVTEDAEQPRRFRNAAIVFLPDGRVGDRYEKVHRVPFGEYVPYRSFFDRIADLSVIPSDAIAGQGPGVLDSPVGRLAVTISYEVFFADRARSGAAAGGRLLLVPTNASSYTTSQVPAQELAAARLRAVETGRWVVQAAPTGYSAIVDQRGRVRARGPLGTPAVLGDTVRLRNGSTAAVRLGDTPVMILAGVLLALAWLRTRKSE